MAKNKKKGRGAGFVLILVGILLFIAGSYLFTRTWGINLLFTGVFLGRMSRYYWLFLLLGVICGGIGALLIKLNPAPKAEEGAKAPAQQPAAPLPVVPQVPKPEKTAAPESLKEAAVGAAEPEPSNTEAPPVQPEEPKGRFCPSCGSPAAEGAKFCGKCGCRLD